MGVIRKSLSLTTVGLVDFRSDKERIARSTRKGAKATKAGNRLLAKQNRLLETQNGLLTASEPEEHQPVPRQVRKPTSSLFDAPEDHLD